MLPSKQEIGPSHWNRIGATRESHLFIWTFRDWKSVKHHSKRCSPNLVLPHRQGKDLMGAFYLVAKETDLLVSILSEQDVVGGSSRLRVKTNFFMFFVWPSEPQNCGNQVLLHLDKSFLAKPWQRFVFPLCILRKDFKQLGYYLSVSQIAPLQQLCFSETSKPERLMVTGRVNARLIPYRNLDAAVSVGRIFCAHTR